MAISKTLVVVTLALATAPARTLPAEQTPWIELRSGSITFLSQVDETETRRIASNLETFREILPRVAPQLEPRDGKPLVVFMFRDETSFAPYKGKPRELRNEKIAGFFLQSEDTDYITLNAGIPGGGYAVVYHEFVHQVIAQRFSSMPLWLNEGLAEYYSTFSTDATRVSVGRPVASHVAWLRDHAPVSLKDLFNTREDSARYNRAHLVDGFYATAWVLVHYLMEAETQPPSRLLQFLGDLKAGKPEAKSHIAAFGLDYRELDAALRAYTQRDNYSVSSWVLESVGKTADGPVEAVPRNRLLHRLGDFLAQLGPAQHEAAEEHLNASLALSPEDPAAPAALAEIRFQQRRYDEASKLFLGAIEKGANDPVVFFRAAKSLLPQTGRPGARGTFVIESATVPPKTLERARELLRRGLALAPESADALADLGRTHLIAEDDPVPGIAALEKALALLPSRPDISWNLAQLYIRQGDRARAAALIEGPVSILFPADQIREAREQLQILDLQAAARLLETGEIERGVERYREILAEIRDPNLRQRIENELQAVESVVAKNRDIAAFNRAVGLANGGDLAGAIQVLEPLAHSCKDPELANRVEKLLADLKRARPQQRR